MANSHEDAYVQDDFIRVCKERDAERAKREGLSTANGINVARAEAAEAENARLRGLLVEAAPYIEMRTKAVEATNQGRAYMTRDLSTRIAAALAETTEEGRCASSESTRKPDTGNVETHGAARTGPVGTGEQRASPSSPPEDEERIGKLLEGKMVKMEPAEPVFQTHPDAPREEAQEGGEDDPYDYIEQLQQEADEVNVLLGGHCFHHEGRMAAIKGLQARAAHGRKMPTVEEVGDVIGRCVFCTWDPLEGTASAARAVLRLLGEGDEPGQEPGGV